MQALQGVSDHYTSIVEKKGIALPFPFVQASNNHTLFVLGGKGWSNCIGSKRGNPQVYLTR